ncbi:hypothetical protein [Bacillus tropicus]|nr:hypothetical protein [Bacillus tropicus]MEC3090652.1 hypothetical protein [Bacillus tropicus]
MQTLRIPPQKFGWSKEVWQEFLFPLTLEQYELITTTCLILTTFRTFSP